MEILLENKTEAFANDLGLGLSWDRSGNYVTGIIDNSSDFNDICSKLVNISYLVDVPEENDISLKGSKFVWHSDRNDNEYEIVATADFDHDEYKVVICEK